MNIKNIFAKKLLFGFCVFFTFIFVVIFQNCAKTKVSDSPQVQQSNLQGGIYHYKLETTGGGDFGYEIQDAGDSYIIQLNHYRFVQYAAGEKRVTVTKTVDPRFGLRAEGEMDVINFMSGSCRYKMTDQNTCPDCLTGTWTSRFVTLEVNQNPVQIYGYESCQETVDESKISSLIINRLNL